MILEYSQLLSTAHRYLDGEETVVVKPETGRKSKQWKLPDDRNDVLYKATHVNHPSSIWVRQSRANYKWCFNLLQELYKEYTERYQKTHACERLANTLSKFPNNIPKGKFTEPTQAMPDIYKVKGDSIKAYRQYYIGAKSHMFKWKNRDKPKWINEMADFHDHIDFMKAQEMKQLENEIRIITNEIQEEANKLERAARDMTKMQQFLRSVFMWKLVVAGIFAGIIGTLLSAGTLSLLGAGISLVAVAWFIAS